MTTARRKELEQIVGEFADLQARIQAYQDDEQIHFDNEHGHKEEEDDASMAVEDAIGNMEEAASLIDSITTCLEEAAGEAE